MEVILCTRSFQALFPSMQHAYISRQVIYPAQGWCQQTGAGPKEFHKVYFQITVTHPIISECLYCVIVTILCVMFRAICKL